MLLALQILANLQGNIAPILIGTVPNRTFTRNAAITAFDISLYFAGGSTYAVTSGTLPTGLSLNTGNGQITGTPTVLGTSSGIVVTATNGFGSTPSNSFNITISQGINVGVYSSDGSLRVVYDTSGDVEYTQGKGIYSKSGGFRINTTDTSRGLYAVDGAFRGQVSNDAATPVAGGYGPLSPSGGLRLTSSGSTRYNVDGVYAKDGSFKVTSII